MKEIKAKINTLSDKDKILLLILVCLLGYYLLVQLPVAHFSNKIATKQTEVSSELSIAEAKIEKKAKMQDYIAKAHDSSYGIYPIPTYNNTNDIINEMDVVLGGSRNYNLTFEDAVTDEDNNIVRREITLKYTASSYDEAVKKLQKLETSRNGYLIKDTSITNYSSNGDDYTARGQMTLTSFERKVK